LRVLDVVLYLDLARARAARKCYLPTVGKEHSQSRSSEGVKSGQKSPPGRKGTRFWVPWPAR